MVSLSTLYNNINTLVNQYVYTKTETRTHFDNYINDDVTYFNGDFIVPSVVYFDDASTDKSSNYTSTNTVASLTYDTTNKYYVIQNKSGSSGFGSVQLNDVSINNHTILSVDVMMPTQTTNTQLRLSIFGSSKGVGVDFARDSSSTSEFSIREQLNYNSEGNTSGYVKDTTTLNYNTWYTMKLSVNEDKFVAQLYDNEGTLIRVLYKKISNVISSTGNSVALHYCYNNNATCRFKNLKVISEGE